VWLRYSGRLLAPGLLMIALPDQLPFEFDLDEGEPRDVYAGPLSNVVSVSQIKMFAPSAKGCPRKWAMHYLAGFPREMTEALRQGIRLHTSIKHRWLLTPGSPEEQEWIRKWSTDPKTFELAVALMRHTPDRDSWISEPTYFLEVPELDTAIYIKPDLLKRVDADTWQLDDWKTTAAKHKRSPWVLQDPAWWPGGTLPKPSGGDTYFSLQNDIQGRMYAHGVMTLFGGQRVNSDWLYGSKKFDPGQHPATWACSASYTRHETREWVETYVWPTIRVMNAIRAAWKAGQIDSPLLVPHNAFSCEHKGKFCEDLLGHCNLWKSPVALEKLHLPVIPA
jgi:hypothetical protein